MRIILFCKILVVLMISACKPNRLDIDVSDIEVNVPLHRFEQELFTQNQDSIQQNIPYFLNKYGTFYHRFMTGILRLGNVEDPGFAYNISHFINDKDMRQVYEHSQEKYSDMSGIHTDIKEAFRHYKYYFPDKDIPAVVTYISGFNYALTTTDSILGIGLDMYMGDDYEYYTLMALPKYKTINMKRENILPDAIRGWVISETQFDPADKNLLEQIIYQGKILYILDALLPELGDSLKIGYTAQQLDWAFDNEENLWAHFIDKQLLYATDQKEIAKYLNEGPFTSGLPKESPPKTGAWLGWQIVRAYTERQDNVNLQKLLAADAQTVLRQSKYKP